VDALKTAAIVLGAAAVAAVLALLLAHTGSSPSGAPTAPVAVRAAFDQRVAQFGDPVTSRVVVTLDRNAVHPGTLRVTSDVAPFTPLARAVTTRTTNGPLETVTIEQRLACLTSACLARTPALPRVHAIVASRAGGNASASTSWRAPTFRSRVDAKDLARSTPRFAVDTAPPAPSYRVSPSTAQTLLEVFAALAAAGAAVLVALHLLGRRRRRTEEVDEMTRALRLVREAEARPAPDRRRALALLARLLHGRDQGDLGASASDLAWSQPPPEPPAVDALVTRVEQEGTA
jgi:hypothetical protein